MFSMPLRILAVSLAAVFVGGAGTAQAEYLMTKKQANSFLVSDVTARYVDLEFGSDDNVIPSCRPSRNKKLNPHKGIRYHRWVCDWASPTLNGTSCDGRMLIVGSGEDINNTYYQWTLKGARCTT